MLLTGVGGSKHSVDEDKDIEDAVDEEEISVDDSMEEIEEDEEDYR